MAASAETARLQTELLRLHLMHRDAARVDVEWRESARDSLGKRFIALARRGADVSDAEAGLVQRRNGAAIEQWGNLGVGLEEMIRVLEEVLTGVWVLGEPRGRGGSAGGRYARVVAKFERWLGDVQDIQDLREQGVMVDRKGDVLLVEGLDGKWKGECASLVRKLDGWRAQLKDLCHILSSGGQKGGTTERTSIERVLEACRSQVVGMLAELDMMAAIERDAVEQEGRWVRMMVEAKSHGTTKAGAIWRVV